MTITDAWTSPAEGGTMDRDTGDALTDTVMDAFCGDLLSLGGTDGLRNKTHSLWVPPEACVASGAVFSILGSHATAALLDNYQAMVYLSMFIPPDFVTFSSVKLALVSAATGNMRWWMRWYMAGDGQVDTTDSYATATETLALTASQLTLIDITSQFVAMGNPSDFIGYNFIREGGDALDTIGSTVHLLGSIMQYRTS